MNRPRCANCDDELQGDEIHVCHECANEAAGTCRWYGQRPPVPGSDLCGPCAAQGQAAVHAGSF
jgi:hypothetical protein